jgi:hypothetical protein
MSSCTIHIALFPIKITCLPAKAARLRKGEGGGARGIPIVVTSY